MYARPIPSAIESAPDTSATFHAAEARCHSLQVLLTVGPMVLTDAAAVLIASMLIGIAVAGTAASAAVWPQSLHAGAVALVCLWAWRQYPGWFLHPAEQWRRIFWATGMSGAVFAAGFEAASSRPLLRPVAAVLAWGAGCLAMILLRAGVRSLLARCEWWGLPVLVIGNDAPGKHFADMLLRHPDLGLRVVGRVASPCPCGSSAPLGCVDSPRDEASGTLVAEYAVLVMSGFRGHDISGVVRQCGRGFRRIFVLWEMDGLSSIAASSGSIQGSFGIEIRQDLFRDGAQLLKRLLDVCVAVALVTALLPLIVVLCAVIRLSSPGPVFYGQQRSGRYGAIFTVWKIRTMSIYADEILRNYLESNPALREEWLLIHKLKDDPRITWIGRLLRKSSLDELPQLWNIFKGEMSLVGPRPIVKSEVPKYGDQFAFYKEVRPGVTGLWQVSGRNNTSYSERVALDRLYVRNWSFALDVYILAKTVHAILTGDGAY